MSSLTGGFTLPGEAGHEDLSLELARRWGADAIRDSDGTSLSPALLDQGMVVYSTVCPMKELRNISQPSIVRICSTS